MMVVTAEKIKEIRRLLSKGIPEGELKNELLSEGYSEDDIKSIFAPRKYDMRSWLLFFSITFLLTGLYFFITNTGRPFLFILLPGFLFYAYYKSAQKHKKEESNKR